MVSEIKYRYDFIGLSTDEKPTPTTSNEVVDGSTYYESDTSKLYVWYNNQWYEKESTGGGGTTYTAGDGIDITDNTISVDTTEIQPKLTAGTGIDITDNTISATGGASPTVVQTTGNSTTDVMSQDATSKLIYPDPSSKKYIAIGDHATYGGYSEDTIAIGRYSSAGSNAIAIGSDYSQSYRTQANPAKSIAIGCQAYVNNGQGAIALGAGSRASSAGELNIGSYTASWGYNASNYRLISGVYDGQNAHDAVTVGQVNSVIDAINTALSTSIPHIGA